MTTPSQPPERRSMQPLAQQPREKNERPPLMSTSEIEAIQDGEIVDESVDEPPLWERPRAAHREADPIFAYLVIVSLGIGIAPLDPMIRYMVLWSLMGIFGTTAYLLGGVTPMRDAKLDDFWWGASFGFLSSFPFLLVFGTALKTVSTRMFDVAQTPHLVMNSWVFMAVVFVLPISETLFFRGGMQAVRSVFLTTGLATLWSIVLFFPHMELTGSATIGIILVIVFTLLNFMYSYVRFRNGLAAAWLCQAISYMLLWFFPRLLF